MKPLTLIATLGGQLRELDVSFNLRSRDFASGQCSRSPHFSLGIPTEQSSTFECIHMFAG